jgi:hypothetical protein
VVRHEDDESAVVDPLLLQKDEEAPDRGVGRRDLAVVRLRRVRGAERLRRRVRCVGLVEVKKEKKGPGDVLLDEILQLPDRLGSGTLVERSGTEVVVVEIEAGGESAVASQRKRRDGRPRGVAAIFQLRRDRPLVGREPEADVVADAVLRRKKARQERRVGRESASIAGVVTPR